MLARALDHFFYFFTLLLLLLHFFSFILFSKIFFTSLSSLLFYPFHIIVLLHPPFFTFIFLLVIIFDFSCPFLLLLHSLRLTRYDLGLREWSYWHRFCCGRLCTLLNGGGGGVGSAELMDGTSAAERGWPMPFWPIA